MANNNETTTRFNVDISQLKSQFAEAQRTVRLATSEFNAATAGMDNWASSSDGLQAKIKQLNSILSAEQSKLQSLQKQHELVVKEQGENSKAAQELQIRINNQQATINRTAQSLTQYKEELSRMQNSSNSSTSAVQKLTNQIKDQESELADLKNKYKDVILTQGNSSDEARALQQRISDLSSELANNRSVLQNASDSADEFDNSLEEVDEGAGEASSAFGTMQVALGKLVADGIEKATKALIEFTKKSISVGADFEASMSKVKAISGATSEEFEELETKAKEMGATTKFSAIESAEAMNYMAMAGWKTTDMIDGIKGIMDLAAASGEDLATTSDIVTDALTAFGLSAADSSHFSDVLAQASSNSNTNVAMMGETFKYVAPIAGTLGYSVDDAAVAIGLMANAGIKASDAGTSLRKGLLNLTTPAKAAQTEMQKLGFYTEEVIDTFDQAKIDQQMITNQQAILSATKAQEKYNDAVENYGESSDEAEKAMLSLNIANEKLRISQEKLEALQSGSKKTVYGYNQAIQNEDGSMKSLRETVDFLRENMQDLSAAEQATAASHIFGTNAVSGMLAVINASDEDYNKLTEAIDGSTGAAERMSAIMQDNVSGDITLLKSQIEGIQIELFEKLEPKIREIIDWISANLPTIAEKMIGVIDGIESVIKAIDTLSPLIVGLGTAIAGLALIGVIQNISMIGAALVTWAASTKLVTAAQWLLNVAMSANPIGLIVVAIAALVAGFVTLWNKSDKFRNFWIKLWEKIKSFAETAVDGIKGAFDGIVTFFTETIPHTFNKVIDFIKGNWQSLLLLIVNPFAGAFKLAYDNCDKFRNFVDNFVGKIKDFFANNWKSLLLLIVNPLAGAFKLAYDNCDGFRNFVDRFVNKVKDLFTNAWNKIVNFFRSDIPNFVDTVIDWLEALPHNIGVLLGKAVGHVVQFGVDLYNFATTKIPEFVDKVIDFIKALPVKAWTWLSETASNVYEFGVQIVETGAEKASEFLKKVISFIKEVPGEVWAWLSEAVSKVLAFGIQIVNTGKEKASDFVSGVINFIKETPGKVWEWLSETLNKVIQWGQNLIDKGKEIGTNLVNTVVDEVKSLPDRMLEIGGNIVQGLWNGISNAKDWIIGKIKDFGSGVIEGFTTVFEIHSPSKVMETLVGNNVAYGFINGVTGKTKEAISAMTKFANDSIGPIKDIKDSLNSNIGANSVRAVNNSSSVNNYNFVQNNTSPRSLSRIEIYRQTRNQLAFARGV